MAIPDYSATGLPHSALVESYQIDKAYQEPDATDMEGGNVRQRPRPGGNVAEISFSILMTQAQFATWKDFALTTLGQGSSRFTMNVWNGNGYVSRTVQLIKGTYTAKPMPPKVAVTLPLRVYGGL